MLDKTIPYYDLNMCRKAGTPLPKACLPPGFRYTEFSPGAEIAWAEIEASVDEFDNPELALKYFQEKYLAYPEEVKRRTIFIETESKEKIATFTIWWDYTCQLRVPSVHWVAVRPRYQGMGLGKALTFEGMELSVAIEGDRDIFLHTQTWSHTAIAVYLKAGFRFMKEQAFGGYKNSYAQALPILRDKLKLAWETQDI